MKLHCNISSCPSSCPSTLLPLISYQGYRAEMEDPSTSNLLPAALRSQKDVLFGNMPEIYQFHSRQDTPQTNTHTRTRAQTHLHTHRQGSQAVTLLILPSLFRVFLQDLQRCLETPEMVGSCFLQRVRKPRRENSRELCCRLGRSQDSHLADLTGSFFSLSEQKEKFQVYERYCQNKPRSELLWRQCSDSVFFQVPANLLHS